MNDLNTLQHFIIDLNIILKTRFRVPNTERNVATKFNNSKCCGD